MKYGRVILAGASLAAVLAATAAQAETAPRLAADAASGEVAAEAADAGDLSSITVVGTKLRGVTPETSATPLAVIGEDALRVNYTDLTASIRALVPSASFGANGGPINARGTNSISLKGLTAGQTLVLVNGKRRVVGARIETGTAWARGSQPVNISAIPQTAVARVEVLQDGASAQYGADAIAGVVNLVLRGNETGGQISQTLGQFYRGDGFTSVTDGWYTFGGDQGFLNLAFNYTDAKRTYHDNNDTRTFYFAGDPREAGVDRKLGIYGNPRLKSGSASLNGELDLSDSLTLYAFGTYFERNTNAYSYYTRPADDNNVRSLFPDGQRPHSTFDIRNIDGAVGLRYDAGEGGQFDLSSEYGVSDWDQHTYGQNPTYGANTPTDFYIGGYRTQQWSTQLDYVKEFAVGYSSNPLTFSAGIAHRWESFRITAGDPAAYLNGGVPIVGGPNAGKFAAPGGTLSAFTPADAGTHTRRSWAAYAGLEQKVTDQFTLGISGRAEDYSDFGSTVAGKISARYDIVPEFAVRGSLSNGFRAPTLGALGASSTTYVWIYPTDAPAYLASTAFLPVNNPVAKLLGAKPLKPEKSVNYSLGFVARPAEGLSFTVDAYQIDIDDGLSPIDNLTGAWLWNKLSGLGYSDVRAVRFFTNAVDYRTRGVDLSANYTTALGPDSSLSINLAGSIVDTKVKNIVANPAELAGSGLTLIGRQSIGYIESWAPSNKWSGTVNYRNGGLTVNLNSTVYGPYRFTAATAALDQKFRTQVVVNPSISYDFKNGFSVTVGANNVFDAYPEKPIVADRYLGLNNFDLQAPEGANGGFYYARVSLGF